jgi:hypothetical protein
MSNKNLSISIYVVLGLALITAISATGYYRSKYLEIKYMPPKTITKTIESAVSKSKDTEIKKLEKELTTLKADVKTRNAETVVTNKPTPKPAPKPTSAIRHSFSLQDLKQTDPERYQRILGHYNKMNKRMSKGVEGKLAFFNDLDTSEMTDEEIKNHQKIVDILTKMQEESEKTVAMDNLEESQSAMREQWKNSRKLSKMMNKTRDYLIADAGRKMGFSNEDAKLLKDYVKNAYEITSSRNMFRGGGATRVVTSGGGISVSF